MMILNVFNKIFESDEYSPTSERFLINFFCCIFDGFVNLLLIYKKSTSYAKNTTFLSFYFADYQLFSNSETLVS
jgi:hypothetical protein